MSDPKIHSLAEAPWYLQVHLAASVLALFIGVVVLARRKGTAAHKAIGWCWVVLMLTAALSSFFVQACGRLSVIHVLSVVVLLTVPLAVFRIRKGDVRAHQIGMLCAFAGLAIAGLFTLLPYRMLGQLLFG